MARLSDNFKRYLISGEKVEALPRLEMMPYNDATVARWREEGLPDSVRTQAEFHDYFGLNRLEFFFVFPDIDGPGCREKIEAPKDFAVVREQIYDLEKVRSRMEEYSRLLESVEADDGILWIPLHGFFWHPRELFGVAEHFMMFYDEPELMHEINQALLEFNLGVVRMIYETGIPSIICVSEDMAYKSGSMISKAMFDEFMAPYHKVLSEEIRRENCVAALDTDGEVTDVTPWFVETGYQCINPMERQTEMDLMRLREDNPEIAFMGGYNKLVMSKGPDAIDAEWASLEPLFAEGKFLPAVDHQTPPEVSLKNYHHYLEAARSFFSRRLETEVNPRGPQGESDRENLPDVTLTT
jgi:uroporphyrinogen-III decarboxylase